MREALPDPVVTVQAPGDAAPDDRQAEGVDAVAEQAEQGGQGDERREQRGDDDQHDADAHADHDVERDDDHAGHGEDDGHAAEEDGAVGGCAGGADGIDLGEAAGPLLAVAADDEQRVVDADRQAHHREDVQDEGVHRVDLADQRGERKGQDDADDAEQYRHAGCEDGAEDDEEHDERGGDAEDLAALQVLLRQLGEHLVDAGVAGLRDREALTLGGDDRGVQFVHVLQRIVDLAGHDDRDQRGVLIPGDGGRVLRLVVGGDRLDLLGPEGGDPRGEAVDVGLEGRVVDRRRWPSAR